MRIRATIALIFFALLAATFAYGSASAAPVLILTAAPPPESAEELPAGVSTEQVVTDLDQPVAMAFDPAGRIFVTEQSGSVRLVVNDTLQEAPVISFDTDSCLSERGLLGIAIDPSFNTNHFIYVYYTQNPPGNPCSSTVNKVVRFVENNGVGSNPTELFSSPAGVANPGTTNHNGGNIHFGPDGKLYITIGDDANMATAQDLTSKNGKIHRINSDGSIPSDNPVFTATGALPSIYARGLRNSFDFAFDPTNNTMWASENGPSCDDELNHILPGGNYGWRTGYPCDDNDGPSVTYNTVPPAWWIPTGPCCAAPTGVEFYSGNAISAWHNELFMCNYGGRTPGGSLRHFHLAGNRTTVTSVGLVEGITCSKDVQTGPDGALYYMDGGTISRAVAAATATPTRVATNTATPTVTGTPPTAVPTATPCPINFSDVPADNAFFEPIRYLYCAGVISGYSDGTFRPNNPTTRGQVTKIVVLAEGWSIDTSGGPHFGDVAADNAFYSFIETAYNHQVDGQSIISGYSDGTFRPNNPVTRGQLSKIVVLAEGWAIDTSGAPHFSDVHTDNPFFGVIETAFNHGIVSGYADGTFKWGNGATRGQISKIVYLAVTSLAN